MDSFIDRDNANSPSLIIENHSKQTDVCLHGFIELLRKIESNEEIKIFGEYYDSQHEDIIKATSMACEYLINEQGHCNWDNMDILDDIGINVFAGEKDSYGWLTGCIRLKNGIIVYG